MIKYQIVPSKAEPPVQKTYGDYSTINLPESFELVKMAKAQRNPTNPGSYVPLRPPGVSNQVERSTYGLGHRAGVRLVIDNIRDDLVIITFANTDLGTLQKYKLNPKTHFFGTSHVRAGFRNLGK